MEREMTVYRLSEQELKWDILLYLYIIVINSSHPFKGGSTYYCSKGKILVKTLEGKKQCITDRCRTGVKFE